MAIISNFNRAPQKQGITLDAGGAKKAYSTTALAGFTVARQRVPAVTETVNGQTTQVPQVGAVLWLTDAEAFYELSQETIELMDPQPSAAPAAPAV